MKNKLLLALGSVVVSAVGFAAFSGFTVQAETPEVSQCGCQHEVCPTDCGCGCNMKEKKKTSCHK